ncbi:MAG TPA: aromatic ring-hydroxylating dioxygenase subunit alpha [Actinomycetota bacterium]|nr:aromatic ring-hydroxylating dioxygenase subunit alpha [Actinomycetota bacterium]
MSRPTAAPIAPERLAPVLAPTLAESRTLPPEAYTAPEVLAWEREHLFEGTWVCLGRAEALGEPGDQAAFRIGREGVLLVRGEDGALRGFYNVCRHRGHELLPCGEARRLRVIRCPYHAWTYALDGRLAGAPRFSEVPGFDRADHPLVPVRVAEWQGFVFANASGDAPALTEWLGNLDRLVAPWEPGRLTVAASHTYAVRANWKVIVENYHECYHCSSIHPALCRVSPPDSGENHPHTGRWVGGSMELVDHAETMSLTGRSDGVRLRGLSDRQAREVWYHGLFPNLLLSLHPDYVMFHRLDPVAPDETTVECAWLFPPEARERPAFDPTYAVEFWDLTNREDWAACESVQRGLASRGARQGPFGRMEDEVALFQKMVARAYLEGTVPVPPPLREVEPA